MSDDDDDDSDEWQAVALHKGELFLLSGPLAHYYLDYAAYDPSISGSPDAKTWRNGIVTVSELTAADFLKALNGQRTNASEIRRLLGPPGTDHEILAFIDFDHRRFVHAYFDQPLEDYTPAGWRGSMADPRTIIEAQLVD